jgi:hypothetical protein
LAFSVVFALLFLAAVVAVPVSAVIGWQSTQQHKTPYNFDTEGRWEPQDHRGFPKPGERHPNYP